MSHNTDQQDQLPHRLRIAQNIFWAARGRVASEPVTPNKAVLRLVQGLAQTGNLEDETHDYPVRVVKQILTWAPGPAQKTMELRKLVEGGPNAVFIIQDHEPAPKDMDKGQLHTNPEFFPVMSNQQITLVKGLRLNHDAPAVAQAIQYLQSHQGNAAAPQAEPTSPTAPPAARPGTSAPSSTQKPPATPAGEKRYPQHESQDELERGKWVYFQYHGFPVAGKPVPGGRGTNALTVEVKEVFGTMGEKIAFLNSLEGAHIDVPEPEDDSEQSTKRSWSVIPEGYPKSKLTVDVPHHLHYSAANFMSGYKQPAVPHPENAKRTQLSGPTVFFREYVTPGHEKAHHKGRVFQGHLGTKGNGVHQVFAPHYYDEHHEYHKQEREFGRDRSQPRNNYPLSSGKAGIVLKDSQLWKGYDAENDELLNSLAGQAKESDPSSIQQKPGAPAQPAERPNQGEIKGLAGPHKGGQLRVFLRHWHGDETTGSYTYKLEAAHSAKGENAYPLNLAAHADDEEPMFLVTDVGKDNSKVQELKKLPDGREVKVGPPFVVPNEHTALYRDPKSDLKHYRGNLKWGIEHDLRHEGHGKTGEERIQSSIQGKTLGRKVYLIHPSFPQEELVEGAPLPEDAIEKTLYLKGYVGGKDVGGRGDGPLLYEFHPVPDSEDDTEHARHVSWSIVKLKKDKWDRLSLDPHTYQPVTAQHAPTYGKTGDKKPNVVTKPQSMSLDERVKRAREMMNQRKGETPGASPAAPTSPTVTPETKVPPARPEQTTSPPKLPPSVQKQKEEEAAQGEKGTRKLPYPVTGLAQMLQDKEVFVKGPVASDAYPEEMRGKPIPIRATIAKFDMAKTLLKDVYAWKNGKEIETPLPKFAVEPTQLFIDKNDVLAGGSPEQSVLYKPHPEKEDKKEEEEEYDISKLGNLKVGPRKSSLAARIAEAARRRD